MQSHIDPFPGQPAPPHPLPSAPARVGLGYAGPAPRTSAPGHEGPGLVRAIGAYKLVKALLMLAVGVTMLRMVHHDVVTIVAGWVRRFHLDPENHFLARLNPRLAHLTDGKLRLLGCGAFAYTVLYAVQGFGLLAAQRWAEWLTVVSGVLLVPIEVYELIRRATPVKGIVLASNVAIAFYLYHHVRSRCRREVV